MELIWTVGLEEGDLGPAEAGVILRALVMYEDTVLGNRALEALNNITRRVETPGRLLCSLWRFFFLSDRSMLEMAAAEAAGSDIILIAFSAASELPSGVNEWINLWLSTRNKRPKALVAFADEEAAGDRASPGLFARLREVARLGRMDFFPANGGTVGGAALQTALTQALALQEGQKARGTGTRASKVAKRPRVGLDSPRSGTSRPCA
jgi:hypothetical protein